MAFQLLQNMASGHVKVKKGTGLVFYMATPSHANERVVLLELLHETLISVNCVKLVFWAISFYGHV